VNEVSSYPYYPLEPLPDPAYQQVWRETVFKHGKLDPQIGDTTVLANFPLVLVKSAWSDLARLAEKLAGEAIAAESELLTQTDLHPTLGLRDEIRKAWKDPARVKIRNREDVRIIRFDFHYTITGWRISEANIDTPGGWIEASGYPREMLKYYPGLQLTGDPPAVLARAIRERIKQGTLVAMIHATAYTEDRWMMVYLSRLIEDEGLRSCLISPSQLNWQDGKVSVDTSWEHGEAGYLVRFFPAEWLPNLPRKSGWENYFKNCQNPTSNPTSALLVQSKRFPLVWDKLSTSLPTWRALLPETRDMRTVQEWEDGEWVLKPSFGRAGEKVSIRDVISEQEWQKNLKEARHNPGDWIAQQRFHTLPVKVNGDNWFPSIGVYTIDGQAAGIYGRISTQRIINDAAKDIAILVET
jgi:glutathionylspermidine synthase